MLKYRHLKNFKKKNTNIDKSRHLSNDFSICTGQDGKKKKSKKKKRKGICFYKKTHIPFLIFYNLTSGVSVVRLTSVAS